jgi:hypothetical protein
VNAYRRRQYRQLPPSAAVTRYGFLTVVPVVNATVSRDRLISSPRRAAQAQPSVHRAVLLASREITEQGRKYREPVIDGTARAEPAKPKQVGDVVAAPSAPP